jgi:hypothetical protein
MVQARDRGRGSPEVVLPARADRALPDAAASRLSPGMPHIPALPFTLRRSNDVIRRKEITSTVETIHGLLRVDGDSLVLQWRVQRQTDRVGAEIRSDRELDPVREAAIPIAAVSGAVVRVPRWRLGRGGRLVLTAADLRAFEGLTGPGGLELAHPAQLVLDVRKQDRDAARELAMQVELAIGDHALRIAAGDAAEVSAPALAGEKAGRKLLGPGGG